MWDSVFYRPYKNKMPTWSPKIFNCLHSIGNDLAQQESIPWWDLRFGRNCQSLQRYLGGWQVHPNKKV